MSNNYICCCAPLRRKLWPLRPIEVLFYTSGWGNIIYWDLIHSGKEKTTCHMCELQMEKCEICLSYREYINKIFFVNDVLIYQLCLMLTFAVLPPWGGNHEDCVQLRSYFTQELILCIETLCILGKRKQHVKHVSCEWKKCELYHSKVKIENVSIKYFLLMTC